jgi:hypothetical protein
MYRSLALLVLALAASVHPAAAAPFSQCQGTVTKIDDSLHGYDGEPGGLVVVSMSSPQCGDVKFWYDDDALKTRNILSLTMLAMASGKPLSVVYDAGSANYGTRGKIFRIAVLQN